MVAVASELRRRGHSVVLTVNVNLAEWAGRTGVEVLSLPLDSEAYVKSAEGQRMLAAGDALEFYRQLGEAEAAANDALVDVFVRAAVGADLILSSGLTMARGAIVAEKFGVPHRMLCLQPFVPTRAFPHAFLPLPSLGLGLLNRWSYKLVFDRVWRDLEGSLNDMRRTLDLTPWARRPNVAALESISCFSEQLVPKPTDWGKNHPYAGFITLRDEDREKLGERALPAGLADWLDAGPAPIFFGFGSMAILDPAAMLEDIEKLCKKLGTRALVGAGWSAYEDTSAREHVFIASTFDHEQVLPRCSAAVHHGGAGTTHTAVRAGLPSLVCSLFGDQPFWGHRIERLGIGRTLRFQKLKPTTFERLLPELSKQDIRRRAAAVGQAVRQEDGAARIAEMVDEIGASRP